MTRRSATTTLRPAPAPGCRSRVEPVAEQQLLVEADVSHRPRREHEQLPVDRLAPPRAVAVGRSRRRGHLAAAELLVTLDELAGAHTSPSHHAMLRTPLAPAQPTTPPPGLPAPSRTFAQKRGSTISVWRWTSTSASRSSRRSGGLENQVVRPRRAARRRRTRRSPSRARRRGGSPARRSAGTPRRRWIEEPNAINCDGSSALRRLTCRRRPPGAVCAAAATGP